MTVSVIYMKEHSREICYSISIKGEGVPPLLANFEKKRWTAFLSHKLISTYIDYKIT